MRGVLLALVLVLAGCGGDDGDAQAEIEERTGYNFDDLEETAEGIQSCVDRLESGDTVTEDTIDLCSSALGSAGRTCGDGTRVVWVTVDDATWTLVEGDPPVRSESMEGAPNPC